MTSTQALSLQPVAQIAVELHALVVELQERRQAKLAAQAAAPHGPSMAERAHQLAEKARELGAQWQAARPEVSALLERTAARLSTLDLSQSGLRARRQASVKVAQYYEGLARTLRREPEVTVLLPELRPKNYARNVFHVGNGILGATLYTLLPERSTVLTIAAIYTAAMLSLELARRLSKPLNRWLVNEVFGAISRPSEAWRMNSASWGGIAIVLMLAAGVPRLGCIAAVLTLGIGDPMAALIGKRWGKHKLVGSKSLEGTLAFVASSALLVGGWLAIFEPASFGTTSHLAALWAAAPLALAAGVAGAMVELVSNHLEDNLSIPLAVAAATAFIAP